MWNEINTEQELHNFLELYGGFHDCCLKELRYISGAFVNQNLGMHPINDQRKLYIVFQRQYENFTVIELEFSGLVKLNLCPNDESYTCEILDAPMFFKTEEFIGEIQIGLKNKENGMKEHGYVQIKSDGELLMNI